MFVSFVLCFSLVPKIFPKIVPIPVHTSKIIINEWISIAKIEGDKRKLITLKKTIDNYDFTFGRNMGTIGVLVGNEIRCISLIEKINKKIYVWDVTTIDYYSGSFLMYTYVKKMKDEIVIMYTVNERWKIAKTYFSK